MFEGNKIIIWNLMTTKFMATHIFLNIHFESFTKGRDFKISIEKWSVCEY